MANHGAIVYGPDLDAAVEHVAAAGVGCAACTGARRRSAPRGARRRAARGRRRGGGRARLRQTPSVAPNERAMDVITLGVHVVDVLVRPVEEIPEGQGGQLVEQIRITPAGSAGGTAITLAKLGARVRSAGAIGDDELGDVILELLGPLRRRYFAAGAARRTSRPPPACCRSAPTDRGPRFTWSAPTPRTPPRTRPGMRSPRPTTCTWARPSSWAARRRPRSCRFAREHGVVTSADLLAPGEQAAAILDWIAPGVRAPRLSAAQRRAGPRPQRARDLVEGCRALLERGVGCVAATCGAEGAVVVDGDGERAGARVRGRRGRHDRLRRRVLGRLPARARARPQPAATRPCSAAPPPRSSPQGLGSDHGDFDLDAADALVDTTARVTDEPTARTKSGGITRRRFVAGTLAAARPPRCRQRAEAAAGTSQAKPQSRAHGGTPSRRRGRRRRRLRGPDRRPQDRRRRATR